jgi:FkbM family methyltransferase
MQVPLPLSISRPDFIPPRRKRPFAGKFKTSLRKRWFGRKQVAGEGKTVRCRYHGADFVVSLDDEVGYEIAINRFEWHELELMLKACERLKPELFLDVGANLGLYSCVLGRRHAAPRIIAFEPDRINFERLKTNVALNDLAGMVEVHAAAAGSRAGTATLTPADVSNRGMSRIDTGANASAPGSYDVPVVTLDDMVQLDGDRIAAKIDVEGHEIEVLMGAAQLFTRNGGVAQIEAHGNQVAGVVTELMATFGWRFVERYGLDVRFEKP